MSEVNIYSNEDDELDRLLNSIQLVKLEPDLDRGNDNNSSVHASQVPLFVAVGPPTEELHTVLGGTGFALDEGSNGERCTEGGLYQ